MKRCLLILLLCGTMIGQSAIVNNPINPLSTNTTNIAPRQSLKEDCDKYYEMARGFEANQVNPVLSGITMRDSMHAYATMYLACKERNR